MTTFKCRSEGLEASEPSGSCWGGGLLLLGGLQQRRPVAEASCPCPRVSERGPPLEYITLNFNAPVQSPRLQVLLPPSLGDNIDFPKITQKHL